MQRSIAKFSDKYVVAAVVVAVVVVVPAAAALDKVSGVLSNKFYVKFNIWYIKENHVKCTNRTVLVCRKVQEM